MGNEAKGRGWKPRDWQAGCLRYVEALLQGYSEGVAQSRAVTGLFWV